MARLPGNRRKTGPRGRPGAQLYLTFLEARAAPFALLFLLVLACSMAQPAGLGALNEAAYAKMVSSQKGKVVLVNFWATYCVPCRKEMPALIQLHERLKARGFLLITVSADEPEDEAKAIDYLNKTKASEPRYLRKAANDDAFINAIDAKWSGALPASFLYDRGGKKVLALFGEADLKQLEAAILKLL